MLAWRVCAATCLLKFTTKALPTKNAHDPRRRRFNAEKANLFSDIKQLSRFSSHLASRTSLLTIYSREINFTPTLNRRRYACMARLRSNISLIKFTAKVTPTKDAHDTRRRRFNAEKAHLFSNIKQPSRFSCTSSHLASRFSYLVAYNLFTRNKFHAYIKP